MHHILASILAAASFAAAAATEDPTAAMAGMSKMPQCAMQCIIQGASSTSCEVTDTYCQCTTGAADLVKSLIPCMCQSECSPQEMMDTFVASDGICEMALAAKGEKFTPSPPSMDVCKTLNVGDKPATSPMPNMAATGTGSSGNGTNSTTNATTNSTTNSTANSTNATSNSTAQQSANGAAGVQAGLRMVATGAVIGLVGAALGAF